MSSLEKFVIKRSAVYFFIFSAAILLFIDNKWFVVAGLVVGTVLSISRFLSYAWIFRKAVDDSQYTDAKKRSRIRSYMIFLFNQLMLLPVLFLAYYFDRFLFWGLVAGTLMVAFVLTLNVITEALGITKNQFFV